MKPCLQCLDARSKALHSPYLFRSGRLPGPRKCALHPNYPVIYQPGIEIRDVLSVLHAHQEHPWAIVKTDNSHPRAVPKSAPGL